MPRTKQKRADAEVAVRRGMRVRVARTKVGWGVFAERWFAASEIIGEIEGQIVDDLDYGSRYCMDLGDSRCLEPAPPFRFMNHCCEPNCTFSWHDIEGRNGQPARRRVFVMANYRIARGDELTIDYRWPPHMAIPCRCGAETCRQWVVAECDLDAVLAAIATKTPIAK
jgi:uncharacterized protein